MSARDLHIDSDNPPDAEEWRDVYTELLTTVYHIPAKALPASLADLRQLYRTVRRLYGKQER
jgi:hypothetical protein